MPRAQTKPSERFIDQVITRLFQGLSIKSIRGIDPFSSNDAVRKSRCIALQVRKNFV